MTPSDQMSTSAGVHENELVLMSDRCREERVKREGEEEEGRTLAKVAVAGDYLGRRVAEGADLGLEPPATLELAAEAHVGNLDVDVLVEEDVLELEVAVDDALAVEVGDAEDELAEDAARFGEGEAARAGGRGALLDEVVEQLAARAQLGDEVDGRLGRDELVEREDVGMSEAAVVVDLAREEREGRGRVRGRVRGEALGDLLDGDAGAGEAVYAESNLAECACGRAGMGSAEGARGRRAGDWRGEDEDGPSPMTLPSE